MLKIYTVNFEYDDDCLLITDTWLIESLSWFGAIKILKKKIDSYGTSQLTRILSICIQTPNDMQNITN